MGRAGQRTLRWAQGPGRQSLFWALVAAAIACLPFLDLVRPSCDTASCEQAWNRVFFLPNLVFIPAVLAICILVGSAFAQWNHARFDLRFWAAFEPGDDPAIPPGHLRPVELEHDLLHRSMRWLGLGALGAVGVFAYFASTAIGRRACDPWRFDPPTGLQVCQGPAQWSDLLIAFEVWLFITLGSIYGLVMLAGSRRFRRRRPRRGRAPVVQAHP